MIKIVVKESFMKKILITLLLITLIFTLASCKKSDKNNGENNNAGNGQNENSPSEKAGLEYEPTADGRYYTLVGINTLESVDLVIPSEYNGKTVTGIAEGVFAGKTNIKTLVIENGVERIGARAFSGCSSLEYVKIADSVDYISVSAFEGCSSLSTLVLGKGVEKIGENAFSKCGAINSLYYEGTIKDFSKITGITPSGLSYKTRYFYTEAYPTSAGYYWYWSEDGSPIVWEDYIGNEGLKFEKSAEGEYYKVIGNSNSTDKTVVIPKAYCGLPVAEIDAMAFLGATIEEIILPETITKISGMAFKWCKNLKSISLPDSVLEIGDSAFFGCAALENIALSKNLKEIGENAFSACSSLGSILIPNSVEKIGNNAFENTESLTAIYYSSSKESFVNINLNYETFPSEKVYFYSESAPQSEGRFWHFDAEGEIVLW